MKQYISLPIEELVSDVPVDPVHTRELADSIKSRGQLAPAIIREETRQVIDGFHRIAAMRELGFREMECVLTPCDDDTFWDFRIMSASLHKAVTFARAVEWIEEVFNISPWKSKYSSGYSLFHQVRVGEAPEDAKQWVTRKAQTWGLSIATIENWLYARRSMDSKLFEEVKTSPLKERLTPSHYIEIARALPEQHELQRKLIEKVEREDLSPSVAFKVAKALKQAEDDKEIESILRQPVSRTEEQMVREAKVEKLLAEPREVTPLEKYQEAKAEDVLYKLDLLGIINSSKAMTPEKINALTAEQKADVYHTCEEAIIEIRRVMDMIKSTVEPEYLLKEG
ncbi:ParB N-terminal domain-containing protein [Dehalococcoidales bacterium]|nr:ParB N-terminal domain-containing protein [Dehalococcoidales bacterium]